MGLDIVELFLEVEETFGISIDDKDASSLNTVGDLYAYILDHRFQGKQDGCLSSVAFYRLRRALMSVLHIPREDVRLTTELASLFPRRRRQLWDNVCKSIALRLPSLQRPKWVTWLSVVMLVAITIAATIFVTQKMERNAGALAGIISFVCVGILLYRITIPLAIEFHPGFATVGNLAKEILRMSYGAISDECGRANDKEIWETLCSILEKQFRISLNAITKEASLVKDLGV